MSGHDPPPPSRVRSFSDAFTDACAFMGIPEFADDADDAEEAPAKLCAPFTSIAYCYTMVAIIVGRYSSSHTHLWDLSVPGRHPRREAMHDMTTGPACGGSVLPGEVKARLDFPTEKPLAEGRSQGFGTLLAESMCEAAEVELLPSLFPHGTLPMRAGQLRIHLMSLPGDQEMLPPRALGSQVGVSPPTCLARGPISGGNPEEAVGQAPPALVRREPEGDGGTILEGQRAVSPPPAHPPGLPIPPAIPEGTADGGVAGREDSEAPASLTSSQARALDEMFDFSRPVLRSADDCFPQSISPAEFTCASFLSRLTRARLSPPPALRPPDDESDGEEDDEDALSLPPEPGAPPSCGARRYIPVHPGPHYPPHPTAVAAEGVPRTAARVRFASAVVDLMSGVAEAIPPDKQMQSMSCLEGQNVPCIAIVRDPTMKVGYRASSIATPPSPQEVRLADWRDPSRVGRARKRPPDEARVKELRGLMWRARVRGKTPPPPPLPFERARDTGLVPSTQFLSAARRLRYHEAVTSRTP